VFIKFYDCQFKILKKTNLTVLFWNNVILKTAIWNISVSSRKIIWDNDRSILKKWHLKKKTDTIVIDPWNNFAAKVK
jgi:hypothetical protein